LNLTAEYIIFVDADDYLTDNKAFEKLYDFAIETKSEIVLTDFLNIYEENYKYEGSTNGFNVLIYLR